MAFTVITAGMKRVATVIMDNFRHNNYGSPILPRDTNGASIDNTIDIGSSSYAFKHVHTKGIGIGTTPSNDYPLYIVGNRATMKNRTNNSHSTGETGALYVGCNGGANDVSAHFIAAPNSRSAAMFTSSAGGVTGIHCNYDASFSAYSNGINISSSSKTPGCWLSANTNTIDDVYADHGPISFNSNVHEDPLGMLEYNSGATNAIYAIVAGYYTVDIVFNADVNFLLKLKKGAAGIHSSGTLIHETPTMNAGKHYFSIIAKFSALEYFQVFARGTTEGNTIGGVHNTSIRVTKCASF